MENMVEYIKDKSIERVFQSWFCNEEKRVKTLVATSDYLSRIYDIIKIEPDRAECKAAELMTVVGLDYGKVYKNGKRISYYTLEEAVHNSLEYFVPTLKKFNLI